MIIDLSHSPSLKDFIVGKIITVSDQIRSNYSYTLEAPVGKNFDPLFRPELTPDQMLELGIFEGKYLNDCTNEFPREWYEKALAKDKLSLIADETKNYFQIKSRQSLAEWIRKGWILPNDPDKRGWFQWYCRYYIGRRIPEIDQRQIKRWRAFARHKAQVIKNCEKGNLHCRPRQRQALLQWAYDPFI